MKMKPVFIAFSTQKGGVGKTTFTVLAASYLHYVCGYNVLVVDCDYPQFSINEMRKRDAKGLKRTARYRNWLSPNSPGFKSLPIAFFVRPRTKP